jgi:hypothetical protein
MKTGNCHMTESENNAKQTFFLRKRSSFRTLSLPSLFIISFIWIWLLPCHSVLVVTVDHPNPDANVPNFYGIQEAVDSALSQEVETEVCIKIYGQTYNLSSPIQVYMGLSIVDNLTIEGASVSNTSSIYGVPNNTANSTARVFKVSGNSNDTLVIQKLNLYQEGLSDTVVEIYASSSGSTVIGCLRILDNTVTTNCQLVSLISPNNQSNLNLIVDGNEIIRNHDNSNPSENLHTIHIDKIGPLFAEITHNSFAPAVRPIFIYGRRIVAEITNNDFFGDNFYPSLSGAADIYERSNNIKVETVRNTFPDSQSSLDFSNNRLRNVLLEVYRGDSLIESNTFLSTDNQCYSHGIVTLFNDGYPRPVDSLVSLNSNQFYGFNFGGTTKKSCVYLFDVGDSYAYPNPRLNGMIDLSMNGNTILESDVALIINRNDTTQSIYTHKVSAFRNNLISVNFDPIYYYMDGFVDQFRQVQIDHCFFENGYPADEEHFIVDHVTSQTGMPYIETSVDVSNIEISYTLTWDANVKSPLINAGCPVIDGVIQTDPDGTPPDIGARYYPHHHQEYFDTVSESNIYWLSFPVVDDKSNTNGTYWNELGYMFHDNMLGPPELVPQLSQIHWSYDGDIAKMEYVANNWIHTDHTAEQPKGYKVKFNLGEHPEPVLVNGFKADPVTTPVAWVEEYLHNGQMQDFPNLIGYFLPATHRAGDALSRNIPGSSRFSYLDYVHTIKTRNWGTCRLSDELNSPWLIDPNTYTLSEGDMVELLLISGAPEEMYWNSNLPSTPPVVRPRSTAFDFEEQLDYSSLFIEFDPEDIPREVGVFIDGVCRGASVVDSSIVDICVYPDAAKSSSEPSIVFYYEGKGAKTAKGWKTYNPESMIFEDRVLNLDEAQRYAYISFNRKAGDSPQPLATSLLPNYPNPFNPNTNISFVLGADMPVTLDIYNIKGQKVRTLCDEYLAKGKHSLMWDGRDSNCVKVASGIYFYRLCTPDGIQNHKMMLMK